MFKIAKLEKVNNEKVTMKMAKKYHLRNLIP